MQWRKIVVLFLVASMVLSLTSCTRQTSLLQEEHTSEENSTVQESVMDKNDVEKNNRSPEEISKKKDSLNENSIDESTKKAFIESDEQSDQKAPSVSQKTEEEIQNIVNEAFEVWKALDQRIWMLFSDRDDLTLSNLIDIYSRYCMNTPEKENLITITEENATEEMKGLRGTFFKAEGFQKFSKHYFGINIKDFTTESPSYYSELDAYSLSPTPPIPIEILLKDYSTNGSQINLIVEYDDNEYDSYQECCVTVVMTEEGFYFDSCKLLYNSEK